MATKKVKKETILQRTDNLKVKVKNFHNEALHVSDNLVEGSLNTGAKWQKIMAKALKGGVVLFGKQQDLVLTALEELKEQQRFGVKRAKKLFGFGMPKTKKITNIKDALKTEGKKSVKKAKEIVVSSVPDVSLDDLTVIKGIGPKIRSLLNQAGITTVDQLAATTIKDLKAILETAEPRFRSLDPTVWVEQAKMFK